MSADYEQLFHPAGDAVQTADEESERGAAAPMPGGGPGHSEVTPPPRQTEVTTQMPPARTAPQQRQPNGMMRAPQSTAPAGARFEQPRSAPTPPPRPAPAPAPSQHFAEAPSESSGAWRVSQSPGSQPATTSAATIGNHRAIDALSHVGVRSAVKMPSQRGWRHLMYVLTRINLGLSPDELYEMDLHNRIRRN